MAIFEGVEPLHTESKAKVVIVGAGPGGLSAARNLSKTADVTIIDAKGYHELNSGTLQMLMRPAASRGVLFDYSTIPNIGRLVRGRVAAVGERSITLETSAEFQFDYLILAPGSTYADNAIKQFGGTVAERQALIEAEHERLSAAGSVLIIGGGIVGVELAGEVVTHMPPGKTVTLVTSRDRLIADKPGDIGRRAQEWLERRGVKVICNTRAVKAADGSHSTSSGEPLQGDVTYMTVGGKPNTAFLRGSSIPLDEKNHIQVDQFLRVRGHQRVFAVGDATDVKETKLGYLAKAQGRLAALNVLALTAAAASAEPATLQAWEYHGGYEFISGSAMLVTLGRDDGVSQGWFDMWLRMMGEEGWFPGWLSAKAAFTKRSRSELGLEELERQLAAAAIVDTDRRIIEVVH